MNLNDRLVTISYYKIAAATLGCTGVACALIAFALFIRDGDAALAFAVLTVPLVAGAGVLRVRAFFSTLCRQWMDVFEAGRIIGAEQEREEGGQVRSLR